MDQNRNHRDLKWIFLSALMVLLSVAIICGTSVLEKAIDNGLFDRPEVSTPDTPDTTAKVVKTGMAIVSAASSSAATEEKDGSAGVDSTLVGVVLVDGRIAACEIDTVQGKISINAKGEITTEAGTEFKTKTELGFDYGMVNYGATPIGKEWFEQVDALEDYVIGMTPDEVKAIALDDAGKATDDDLKAGCTIGVKDYLAALVTACENAKEMGANADDTLNIAITAKASADSKSAAAEGAGTAQIDIDFAVVTTKDGKVTSVLLDCLQAKLAVNADGTVGDASLKTKKELGFDYGMVNYGATPIGKEWFEQVEAFEKAASGGYEDLKISAEGYAEDDLKSSCTINLYPFTGIINKALGK